MEFGCGASAANGGLNNLLAHPDQAAGSGGRKLFLSPARLAAISHGLF